ncbi:MAG: N-acetyltransferase [Marmoricola sp.]|nr:N-acetyltransferase [Marmoricola sp.]
MADEVRAARAGDDVDAVVTAAFGHRGEVVAALWRDLESSGRVLASLVVERDGRTVGHVGLSPAWVDARRELVDVWLLSPLSVHPEHQGRGVGTALVAAAIEAAREGGAPLLFLEGDPGYYGPRGFRPADGLDLRPPTDRIPPPAFQVVRYAAAQDWMTGRVVYPDVWWRHDLAGLRDPELARIEEGL